MATVRSSERVELEPWEVGGELIDILSRGLYSDARDAVREYVQNGVDAGARRITVTIDGPSVVVRDDGAGMNDATIRHARRFGMSEKSPLEAVGFRGIGIYASFGVCDEMTLLSRQAGMTGLVGWRFEFGSMRRILEADRLSARRQGIGLANLLHEHTELLHEPYNGPTDDSFTVVRLDRVGTEYRAQLNDATNVGKYLLDTTPVAFPERGYGPMVNDWLHDYVGQNAVRIQLRVSTEPAVDLHPPIAVHVDEPEYDWLEDAQGNRLAFVWHALSTTGKQLGVGNSDGAASGFLLKMRGFTLGNRDSLQRWWPKVGGGTLYRHHTGEVHILPGAAGLYPNAARNDLEPGPAKQAFLHALAACFDRLNRLANLRRAMARCRTTLLTAEAGISSLQEASKDADQDPYTVNRQAHELRTEFEDAERDLKKHAPRATGKARFEIPEQLAVEIDELYVRLRRAVELADAVVRTTTRAASKPSPNLGETKLPPQAAAIQRALEAARNVDDETVSGPLAGSLTQALEAVSVANAVAVLDELKASGFALPAALEQARRELRIAISWSPTAPVSLSDALSELGMVVDPAWDALLKAVDQGLLGALGGRGTRYETTLAAVARSIADSLGN